MKYFQNIFFIFFIYLTTLNSQDFNLMDGIKFYNDRHNNNNHIIASLSNIDQAINIFSKLLIDPDHQKEAALYLLKCYYFKGEYTNQSDENKKILFSLGKTIGEKYIETYPESEQFRYWYLVNLGSWAQVYGIFTAAREGVADIMLMHSNKIIELNIEYENGGGYFMLGAVHFKSPYIPFLLPWPDNDEAIKYLQLSVNTGTATLNQKNYLAQALYEDGNTSAAITLLNEVIKSSPRTTNLIEDLNDIEEAKELLKDY